MAKSNEIKWAHVNGDLVAEFTMTVSGGDLPRGYEADIPVVLNLGRSLDAVKEFVAGGQSARVTMQGVLRKFTQGELSTLVTKGVKVNVVDVRKPDAYRDPEMLQVRKNEAVAAAVKTMSKEQLEAMAAQLAALLAAKAE